EPRNVGAREPTEAEAVRVVHQRVQLPQRQVARRRRTRRVLDPRLIAPLGVGAVERIAGKGVDRFHARILVYDAPFSRTASATASALLYKAKRAEDKDLRDFAACLSLLEATIATGLVDCPRTGAARPRAARGATDSLARRLLRRGRLRRRIVRCLRLRRY